MKINFHEMPDIGHLIKVNVSKEGNFKCFNVIKENWLKAFKKTIYPHFFSQKEIEVQKVVILIISCDIFHPSVFL